MGLFAFSTLGVFTDLGDVHPIMLVIPIGVAPNSPREKGKASGI